MSISELGNYFIVRAGLLVTNRHCAKGVLCACVLDLTIRDLPQCLCSRTHLVSGATPSVFACYLVFWWFFIAV